MKSKAPFKHFRVDCYDSYLVVMPMPQRRISDVSAAAQFVKQAIVNAISAAQDDAYREELQHKADERREKLEREGEG